eukprot:TRINITY_DN91_c0_g1_i3.p3 TRINITY_DN91_c0_g1~~TRINITY_DN91_c0_g1_i3.p3  ORF type:complete len:102 (-),score=22.13 TRINITY_DN91_c0_g1_i3:583-888(-)
MEEIGTTIVTTGIELGVNKQVRMEDQTEDQIEIRIETRIETRIITEDPKLEEAVEVVAEASNQTTDIKERTSLSVGELGAPSSLKVKGSLLPCQWHERNQS